MSLLLTKQHYNNLRGLGRQASTGAPPRAGVREASYVVTRGMPETLWAGRNQVRRNWNRQGQDRDRRRRRGRNLPRGKATARRLGWLGVVGGDPRFQAVDR